MHSAPPPVIVFLLLAPSLSWSFTQISVPRTNWLGRAPSPSSSFSNRLSFQLHAATSDPHDEAGNEKLYHGGSWKLTNDFTTFLNQVTIQSLIFLINSLKDRHTALWLEDFTQPVIRSGFKDEASEQVLSDMAKAMSDAMRETQMERPIRLLTYHGIGAINTTIFPTWDSYFEQLLQEDGVTYSIQSSRPNVPSYELDINPASLCSRLISVREQIAKEFVNDLDVIAEMSAAMMQRYLDSHGTGEMEDSNLLFLEGDYEYTPSPLRKGNFDLLLTITTQEAIHRVLNDEAFQQSDKSSVLFLRNFYLNRIPTHFSGSNWYGKAEGFLSELLKLSPSVVQLQDDDCDLVDPLRVADLILIKREQVAEEWLELALDVPESHTDIKRMQFNRLMGRAIDEKIESGFE